MQAARYLVGAVVELSAGVQHGHDDLGGGDALLAVNVDRYAAAVVADRYRFVGMNGDHDAIAVAGQRFVNGVVHHLEHHVMQAAAVIGISDVHSGPFANGIEAF